MLTPKVEQFFYGCNNPIAISDVITSMAAGNVMQVKNIPDELIPAVILLSTIGLREYEQQIIDDYEALIQRAWEKFREPHFTNTNFWHPQLFLVSGIVERGSRGEYTLNEIPEAGYMFDVYSTLVNGNIAELTGDTA